jgi:hypothetical protein
VKTEWRIFLFGKDYVETAAPLTGSAVQSHEVESRTHIELGDSTYINSTVVESTILRSPKPRLGIYSKGTSTMVESEFESAVLPRDSDVDDLQLRPTLEAVLEADEEQDA